VETESRALATETGQLDPRTLVTQLPSKAADNLSTLFIPNKFYNTSLTAGEAIPEPIVRYAEAQLILAEAQGGAAAVTIINSMRAATVPALNPYTGPTDAASITALVASERQRALFFEGFRAFDVERLNLAFVPAVGAPYLQGGTYGHQVCFGLPAIERLNNPNVDVSQIITGVRGSFTIP
jgi:hypothetical protein